MARRYTKIGFGDNNPQYRDRYAVTPLSGNLYQVTRVEGNIGTPSAQPLSDRNVKLLDNGVENIDKALDIVETTYVKTVNNLSATNNNVNITASTVTANDSTGGTARNVQDVMNSLFAKIGLKANKYGDTFTGDVNFTNVTIPIHSKPNPVGDVYRYFRGWRGSSIGTEIKQTAEELQIAMYDSNSEFKTQLIIPDNGCLRLNQQGKASASVGFAKVSDITPIGMYGTNGHKVSLTLRKSMSEVDHAIVTFCGYDSATGKASDNNFLEAIVKPRDGGWGHLYKVGIPTGGDTAIDMTYKVFTISTAGLWNGYTHKDLPFQSRIIFKSIELVYKDSVNMNT